MYRRRAGGFGLIELLIVLVLGVFIFFFLQKGYFRKERGMGPMRYDKVYNDAKKQLEKVSANRSDY